MKLYLDEQLSSLTKSLNNSPQYKTWRNLAEVRMAKVIFSIRGEEERPTKCCLNYTQIDLTMVKREMKKY